MSCSKWKTCWISLFIIGVLQIVAFGVIGWILVPMFYSDNVVKELRTLYGESGAGEHWRKFGIPSYQRLEPTLLLVRLFNVTNPGDIVRNGMKPILKEVGPYVYMVEKVTEIVSRNTEEETTEFKQKTFYQFSPQHSPKHLHETDMVTVLNVPYMEIVGQMSNVPAQNRLLTSLVVAMSEEEDTVFIRRSVREILFSGFSQPSLGSIGKLLGNESTKLNGFSFIQPENGTESPVYKVYVGHGFPGDSSTISGIKFGDILKYGEEKELPYWADSYGGKCNKIGGNVDGMIFEQLEKTSGALTVFHPEMCRTLAFNMNGHTELFTPPIKSYRFVLNAEQLKDSKEIFDNSCYCPREGIQLPGCVQAGTISNCREGFPFVTTLPHFLDAETSNFSTQVIGLKSDRESHESYVDLEPITGLATLSSAKFQLNYQMKPLNNNEDTKSLPNVLLPILWTAEVKEMNSVFKNIIEQNIYKPLGYSIQGMWASLIAGVVFILVALFIMILRRKRTASSVYFNTLTLSRSDFTTTKTDRNVSFKLFKRVNDNHQQAHRPPECTTAIEDDEPFFAGLQRQASIMAVTGSKIPKEAPASDEDKARLPLLTRNGKTENSSKLESPSRVTSSADEEKEERTDMN